MRFVQYLVSAVVGLSALLIPAAASAQDYPPPGPSLTVSAGTVDAGGRVEVSGSAYGSNESVSIDLNYLRGQALGGTRADGFGRIRLAALETVTANPAGSFHTSMLLARPGVATITATGDQTGRSASVTVTVLGKGGAATAPPAKSLPTTGTSGWLLGTEVLGGAAVTLVGTLLVVLTVRHRRKRTSAAPDDAATS